MRAVGLAVAGLAVLLLVLRPDLGRTNFVHMETRDEPILKASAREALEPRTARSRKSVDADNVESLPPGLRE